MLLIGLLALEWFQSPAQGETRFVPALDWKSQPVAEWVRRLDSEQVSARDAAWCLYYADDRSPTVVDAMRRALWTPRASDAHHAIDAILAHWGVPFEPLPAAWFPPDGDLRPPESLFPLPKEAARGVTEDLVLDLQGRDQRRKVAAALALLGRDEKSRDALVVIVDALEGGFAFEQTTREWLYGREARAIGGEVGERIVRALADGREANKMHARLLLVESPTGAHGAAHALADLAESASSESQLAAKFMRNVCRPSGEDTLEDSRLHRPWMKHPVDDPEAEAAVARHYGRLVDLAAASGSIETELLIELQMRVQCCPKVVAAITPGLLALLDQDGEQGLEVLRVLCHARCQDPRVRTAWLVAARGWTDFSVEGLEKFPCLSYHDPETLIALDSVLRRAESVIPFMDRLAFAGLLDAECSPLVRHLLDHLGETPDTWSYIVEDGFRGLVDEPLEMPDGIRANDDHGARKEARALRMNRLALNLATLKERGESFDADEAAIVALLELPYPYSGAGGYDDYVEWGFFHARTLGLHSEGMVRVALRYASAEPFRTHADAANAFFESAELTLPQQIELDRAIPYRAPGTYWRGISIVEPRFDGRNCGRFALERTPTIRRVLYEGNVHAIEELAEITRLIDRDLDYALATLRYGPAKARLFMLDFVERHALDGERVRAAVRRRLSDVDYLVRHRAQELIERRAW